MYEMMGSEREFFFYFIFYYDNSLTKRQTFYINFIETIMNNFIYLEYLFSFFLSYFPRSKYKKVEYIVGSLRIISSYTIAPIHTYIFRKRIKFN